MNPPSQMPEAGYPKPADTSYIAYTPLSVLGVAHFGVPWLCSSQELLPGEEPVGFPREAAPPSSGCRRAAASAAAARCRKVFVLSQALCLQQKKGAALS